APGSPSSGPFSFPPLLAHPGSWSDRLIYGGSAVSDLRNVIIVGSGPAGLTAAIYAGRANLSPLIVAGSQPGGQLTLTSEVENYPGFAEPVLGPELMDVMRRQAERFGTEFIDDDVVGVDLSSRPFEVKTAERTWHARALV